LPRSIRFAVPVSRLSCRSRKSLRDLLALGVADLLQDHLLRRLRTDAPEPRRPRAAPRMTSPSFNAGSRSAASVIAIW
jgi:hypothetical protein